jgi:hypothetical protein
MNATPNQPPLFNAMSKGNYVVSVGAGGGDFDMQFVTRKPYLQGMFGQSSSVRTKDIRDGQSNTVAASEIWSNRMSDDCRGTWSLPIMGASLFASRSDDPNPDNHLTPNRVTPDGSGDRIPYCNANNDPKFPCTLVADESPAMQPLQQRTQPRLSLQGAAPRSRHPSGVLVALADGSVRFISEQINQDVWTKVLTIRNQDPVDDSEF